MSPRRGKRYAIPDLCLGMSAFFRFHLACARAMGSDEPWLIATNLATPISALKEYAGVSVVKNSFPTSRSAASIGKIPVFVALNVCLVSY
jgi:hypothetical protein